MAGAGYKLFATGDVLTAAQVNTYLNEQTVMVFANSAARTTALSGVLAEGMMSYLQDTNAVEVYNGTAWVGVSGAGDVTEVQAGVGISVASGTGPIPVITNSSTDLITTAGDILYGTAADTVARLGIGTAGQVLKVNSGATAPEWGAAAGASPSWSLLNSGGTALTGAQTITVSGISGKNQILILIAAASSASASSEIGFRFNADTGSNYYLYAGKNQYFTTYVADDNSKQVNGGLTVIQMAQGANASSVASGYCLINGANSSGVKTFTVAGGATFVSGTNAYHIYGGGYYDSSSTISSVSVRSSNGNFDSGTIFVYESAV